MITKQIETNQPDLERSMKRWERWIPSSLADSLLIILLLFSILPTLGLGGIVYYIGYTDRLRLLQDQFYSGLILKEQLISSWVAGRERDLLLMSSEPDLLDNFRQVLREVKADQLDNEVIFLTRARLIEIELINEQFMEFMLLESESGTVVVSSQIAREGTTHSNHAYFREGMKDAFVQSPFFDVSLALNEPTMVVSRPILSPDGRVLGVLAGIVNLSSLDKIMSERTGLGATGTTYMINKSGFLISATRLEDGYSYQKRVRTVAAEQALRGEEGFATYDNLGGKEVFGIYTWLPELESALIVEQNTEEAFARLNRVALSLGVTIIAIWGVIIISSAFMARSISRPIIRLTETAQAIQAGDLSKKAIVNSRNEIGRLAHTFNSMTAQLKQTLEGLTEEIYERKKVEKELALAHSELEERVRQRTAELTQINQDMETLLYVVSHDLKEPLRAIENFSRLISRRYNKQLDHKGQDFLQRINRAAARLRTLIDDILKLSRAKRMELPSEKVCSKSMIENILARLEISIQERQAKISLVQPLPKLRVNHTWATEAIYNLISNALKYTPEGIPPEIEITGYHGPEGIGLMVKDRGLGVPPEYRERIFQLFQRAVGREIEGTGAGLAIVRQIAQRHGGHAWVQAREGGGSEFIITFADASSELPINE